MKTTEKLNRKANSKTALVPSKPKTPQPRARMGESTKPVSFITESEINSMVEVAR